MRRASVRGVLALAGAVLVAASIGLTALPAAAHDKLIDSDPAAGSTIAAVPETLTLGFNDDVMDISAFVIVRDSAGGVLLNTEATVDGSTVSAPMPAGLPDGQYSVAWRVISADGAPVQGSFDFAVAADGPVPGPAVVPVAPVAPVAAGVGAASSGTAGWIVAVAATLAVAVLVGGVLVGGVLVRIRRRRIP